MRLIFQCEYYELCEDEYFVTLETFLIYSTL